MYHYLKDKSDRMKQSVWEIMERMQEEHPYLEFGWDGFVAMVVYR